MRLTYQKILPNAVMLILLLVIAFGVFLRFYNINQNTFIFYDEGLYLNYNRFLVESIERAYPKSTSELFQAVHILLRAALASGKALWLFVIDMRVFFSGGEAWFFPRMISAVAGCLTLALTFLFALRLSDSRRLAWLSVAVLAVLPSHVFYSRLAMQEGLCTFLFLAGFYCYLFPRRLNWRTFASAILFAAAFFTNYRLIILPILIAGCEALLSVAERRRPDFRKYLWHTLSFFTVIFLIGNIDQAQNTVITFAWMFHQSSMAQQQLDWLNFFSYPYYLVRLESPVFAILFFANIYFLIKRQWLRFLPAFLVLMQMGIFSFAAEKGARYVCVVTPFMAIAVASWLTFFFKEQKSMSRRIGLIAVILILWGTLIPRSVALAKSSTDYQDAVKYLRKQDPEAKVIGTQRWLLNLHTRSRKDAVECPREYKYFLQMYLNGYRYLELDPQMYISLTANERRFSPPLVGYLEFIVRNVPPLKVFPHFNEVMLERFVFEHNENLRTSLQFLRERKKGGGLLFVYDIQECVGLVNSRLKALQEK